MSEPAVKATQRGLISTAAEFPDYKTGDTVTCLSQGEMMLWYILRWNDDVDHIDMQVPLDNECVDEIYAKVYGSPILPGSLLEEDNREHLSTDAVAVLRNGQRIAYQVKANRNEIKPLPEMRRLVVEKLYWQAKGVKWYLVFKEDINQTYVENLRNVARYYDESNVHDDVSALQHKAAVKEIKVDMRSQINWPELVDQVRSDDNA